MRLITLILVISLFTISLYGQGVTTSSISGRVTDSEGKALIGASVSVIHLPSGTKYGTITRDQGRFTILGLRVGGPYQVNISFLGYEGIQFDNVYTTLGNTVELNVKMKESSVQKEEVIVFGKSDAVFNSDRTGAESSISIDKIDVLPTISRRIQDFLRLTPQFGRGGFKNGSVAGQDNRMNNITIDGSYFNNSFGLAGAPGERTNVAAVSIDALEQLQVNIAPYDVRQGNFVGAGINAVTKSGTNDYSASIYYQTRNESFVGTKAADATFNPGTFKFNMFGARLGGPIIENKLFFFTNFETEGLTQPGTTYLANEGNQTVGGNITRVLKSDLDNLSKFLREKFNYETGPYQGYDFETPALRFIFRLDYNIDENNKINLRYNHLDSKSDILLSNSSSLGFGNRRSSTQALNFKNSNYAILENIRSIIGEWNSVLSNNMTNSLIVGYRFHDESREQPGKLFPFVDILKENTTYTSFGTEPFTPDNALTYSTFQFQNNFNWFLSDHNLLFGLSLEWYESKNIFFPGSQSVYVYKSLEDFYTDANDYLANPQRTTSPVRLRRFQYRYSNIPGQDKPIQPLKVLYSGIYAQDTWTISDALKLTAGVRVDIPFFSNTGYRNTEVENLTFKDENGQDVKYATDKLPDPRPLISPRIGFNYDISGDRSTQLRGGTGIFTGIPAFVWISNQIGNNGILTGFERRDDSDNNPLTYRPFNPNPNAYKPSNITGAPAANYELALTDPKFKFPQIWRTNFGIDQKLPFDLVGTLDFMYNKDVNGIYYINANLTAPNSNYVGADTRPRWTGSKKINSKIDNAIVLKNQDVGYSWNIAVSIEKPLTDGLSGKIGYSYGQSKNTVDPGSIAFGSWNNNQHSSNPNNPGLSYSFYNPDHRFFAALSYRLDYFDFGATTLSFFWDIYSGNRTSYVFAGDFNGDGGTSNDLIYVPKDASEMYFQEYKSGDVTFTVAQQQEAWNKYIEQDDYLKTRRGQYAERNGVVLPSISRIDLGVSQEFYAPFLGKRNAIVFRLDILNFSNLLNKDWGVGQELISNQPLISQAAAADGKPVYRLRSINNKLIEKSYTTSATLEDVYRLQFTIRYLFN